MRYGKPTKGDEVRFDRDNGESRMAREVRDAFTSPAAAAPTNYGNYSVPRACEREGCSATFVDRAAYWTHRLAHEQKAENG